VSIRFSIVPAARLVTYTVEGIATDDRVREFLDAVLADPHFRRGFNFVGEGAGPLAGLCAAYSERLSRAVLAQRDRLAPCRWAVVIGYGSVMGLNSLEARAVLARACDVEVDLFMDRSEAINWLGATLAESPSSNPPQSEQRAPRPAADAGTH
jgi:hypothetical protein